MKELTKAEEQVMQILWKINKGFVKDVIPYFPEPRPAYNTVSTIIRILETKGFVSHNSYGKTHEYYPLISKEEYTRVYFKGFLKKYFSDSFKQMVSFFAKQENMSVKEMEELMQMLEKEIDSKKK